MKILHVTSHLNVGGISRYVVTLSEKLAARGHQMIVASGGGRMESRLEQLGIPHWKFPFHTKSEISFQVFRGACRLMARLKKGPVDLLHAHTRVGQMAAELVRLRTGIPYVTTWHGIFNPHVGRRLWPCTGTRVIAVSHPVQLHLMKDLHVPAEKIRCIHNGVDTAFYAAVPPPAAVSAYRRRWDIPMNHPIIGSIGRLAAGKVKGFDTLLAAAFLLKEKMSDVHVVIVGEGPRRPFLEDVANRLGIKESVHFVGPSDDVRIPLALMDVFVFPSRWPEAFGLTLVEAMAAGKPVVATNVGAVSEIIQNGESGCMVSPDDPAALSADIAKLLHNPSLAQRLGRQGQIRAQQAFNLDQMVTKIEGVYQEVIGRTDL